jgi:hypothetical protein
LKKYFAERKKLLQDRGQLQNAVVTLNRRLPRGRRYQ